MNRRIFLMGVAGATVGCTSGRVPRLNIFNWENYIAAATIPNFEREFRCRVHYATYGSAEEMLAKVMGGNSGWDVVFPSNSFVQPMRELELLEHLDHWRIQNLGNLDPRFQSPEWDPALEWSVPYMHSATGILYSRKVKCIPARWEDLWVDCYSGRMTMLDDPAEVFAACLKLAGDSLNSGDETQLRAARDLAVKQKPFIRAYLNEEVRDQVIAGDILVAQMWAQVAQAAIDNSSELSFCFPAEGFALYADNACVLRESKHKELAYRFLDYLLRPEVAAAVCSEMKTATTNARARALLPPVQQMNTVLYPAEDVLGRGEWFKALPASAQQLRDRYWTEIKSA